MICEICKLNEAIAWFNNQHICRDCWNAYKYKYIDKRIERLENDMENN